MSRAFKSGDKLRCRYNHDGDGIRADVTYTAFGDEWPGIFPDRPFIIVTAAHLTQPMTCHASRFVLESGEENDQ